MYKAFCFFVVIAAVYASETTINFDFDGMIPAESCCEGADGGSLELPQQLFKSQSFANACPLAIRNKCYQVERNVNALREVHPARIHLDDFFFAWVMEPQMDGGVLQLVSYAGSATNLDTPMSVEDTAAFFGFSGVDAENYISKIHFITDTVKANPAGFFFQGFFGEFPEVIFCRAGHHHTIVCGSASI